MLLFQTFKKWLLVKMSSIYGAKAIMSMTGRVILLIIQIEIGLHLKTRVNNLPTLYFSIKYPLLVVIVDRD